MEQYIHLGSPWACLRPTFNFLGLSHMVETASFTYVESNNFRKVKGDFVRLPKQQMHQSFPCISLHLLIAFRINGEENKSREVRMYFLYTRSIYIFPLVVFIDYLIFSYSFSIKYFCFLSHTEAVMKAPTDYEFYKPVFSCLLCYDLRQIWDR